MSGNMMDKDEIEIWSMATAGGCAGGCAAMGM
jgi:hypothetical protein